MAFHPVPGELYGRFDWSDADTSDPNLHVKGTTFPNGIVAEEYVIVAGGSGGAAHVIQGTLSDLQLMVDKMQDDLRTARRHAVLDVAERTLAAATTAGAGTTPEAEELKLSIFEMRERLADQ